jgi:acetyltransferase EpsM
MNKRIIIIGAGGHAKVVYETILAENKYSVVGFTDGSIELDSLVIDGKKILMNHDDWKSIKDFADCFIVAIGNNKIREQLFNQLIGILPAATVIHPASFVSKSAVIGQGSVVLANSVINTLSIVGENSIINCGVLIDHESKIGNHVHLSLGCKIGSNSSIGDSLLISSDKSIPSFSKIESE